MPATLGVDIGGTKIAAGVVDDDGTVLATARRETPADDPDAIEVTVAELVAELTAQHPAEAVGVAAAGFVDEARSTVRFAPNLAWRDRALAEPLRRRTGLDVVVENDANAAAWAEFRFGAGRDVDDIVLITLGTGVGGGVVIDGRLLRGAFGSAAEIGHVRAVPGGLLCGCGKLGCWEQYIAGNALVRRARELASDPEWSPALLEAAGGDGRGIDGPLVTKAAAAGDAAVVALLVDYSREVGAFAAQMVAVLDPAVVVLGGGVSAAGDLLLEPAHAGFRAALTARGRRPEAELRLAQLGNAAGMVGVADLARTAGVARA